MTEAVVLYPYSNSWTAMSKFVFTYADETMPLSRYATMINSFLLGEENNYYKYYWY